MLLKIKNKTDYTYSLLKKKTNKKVNKFNSMLKIKNKRQIHPFKENKSYFKKKNLKKIHAWFYKLQNKEKIRKIKNLPKFNF